jgi:hypothetical protein
MQVEVIDEQEMLAPPQTLASLELSTITPHQLMRLERELHFTIARDGDFGGVCCWFDTFFDGPPPRPTNGVWKARVGSKSRDSAQPRAS